MKKIIASIILASMIIPQAWAVTQWTATGVPTSSSDAKSNFPSEVYSQWGILQTLLQNYRQGYYLTYDNSSTITIGGGEVSVWNGSAALFLQNASSQTATKSNLDTGSSFSASTTYYVYCGTSSATAATCTITISLNNSAPTGVTYYKQLGSFTTDSSGNIQNVQDNLVVAKMQGYTGSYTINTNYTATTDGFVFASGNTNSSSQTNMSCIDNGNSIEPAQMYQGSWTMNCTMAVKKGDVWSVTTSGGGFNSTSVAWEQFGQ